MQISPPAGTASYWTMPGSLVKGSAAPFWSIDTSPHPVFSFYCQQIIIAEIIYPRPAYGRQALLGRADPRDRYPVA